MAATNLAAVIGADPEDPFSDRVCSFEVLGAELEIVEQCDENFGTRIAIEQLDALIVFLGSCREAMSKAADDNQEEEG